MYLIAGALALVGVGVLTRSHASKSDNISKEKLNEWREKSLAREKKNIPVKTKAVPTNYLVMKELERKDREHINWISHYTKISTVAKGKIISQIMMDPEEAGYKDKFFDYQQGHSDLGQQGMQSTGNQQRSKKQA